MRHKSEEFEQSRPEHELYLQRTGQKWKCLTFCVSHNRSDIQKAQKSDLFLKRSLPHFQWSDRRSDWPIAFLTRYNLNWKDKLVWKISHFKCTGCVICRSLVIMVSIHKCNGIRCIANCRHITVINGIRYAYVVDYKCNHCWQAVSLSKRKRNHTWPMNKGSHNLWHCRQWKVSIILSIWIIGIMYTYNLPHQQCTWSQYW